MPPPSASHPAPETETDDLYRTIESVDSAELLALVDDGGIDALALHDALPTTRAAAFIQLLKSGAVLSEPMRDVLIDLLSRTIVAAPSTPAAVRLIQGGSLKAGSSFPHLVEWNGALSEEDEACEWQQQKTKLTRITVQLRNQQGALPPHPCPHASHLVHVRSCLVSSWYPVPVAGEKVKGSTLQVGGLVLQLTLHKAANMELLSDNHNPRLAKKGEAEGLLAITGKCKEEESERLVERRLGRVRMKVEW